MNVGFLCLYVEHRYGSDRVVSGMVSKMNYGGSLVIVKDAVHCRNVSNHNNINIYNDAFNCEHSFYGHFYPSAITPAYNIIYYYLCRNNIDASNKNH